MCITEKAYKINHLENQKKKKMTSKHNTQIGGEYFVEFRTNVDGRIEFSICKSFIFGYLQSN